MLFTSESVTEGHPDKLCDQISDAVLDECLRQDPLSRVACNTYATMGLVVVGGEVTTKALFDVAKVAREVIGAIGYDASTTAIAVMLHQQSPDISAGVSREGAGDQGSMFGYACRQTKELMPLPIVLAHDLAERLANVRKTRALPFLRPDGKTQVTVEYRDGKPARVAYVVIGASHTADVVSGEVTSEDAKRAIVEHVVRPVLEGWMDDQTTITINGAGKFVVSGTQADTGMTGRKIVVDTYGGWIPHGGGAFSGKDPTKVDRSAGYMTRYIAKNLVAAGLADECLVQLAYCIGLREPVSVFVDTRGTGKISNAALTALVRKVFPLTPKGMIEALDLREPIYARTASYGHFGRPEFAWERTDAVERILHEAR